MPGAWPQWVRNFFCRKFMQVEGLENFHTSQLLLAGSNICKGAALGVKVRKKGFSMSPSLHLFAFHTVVTPPFLGMEPSPLRRPIMPPGEVEGNPTLFRFASPKYSISGGKKGRWESLLRSDGRQRRKCWPRKENTKVTF